MTAVVSTKAKRGRPKKVVTSASAQKRIALQTESVSTKYFGMNLTIKDAFDAIARLEQRIVKLEKRGK